MILEKYQTRLNAVCPGNIHARAIEVHIDVFEIILERYVLWMIQMKSIEW